LATIGIRSGVADAIEWRPIGRRAVALRRNMTSSPCYLARMDDCPRDLTCMRGLEPSAMQEVSEILLARPVVELPVAAATGPLATMPVAKPRHRRRRQVSSASAH
jgi:hypothetical protein